MQYEGFEMHIDMPERTPYDDIIDFLRSSPTPEQIIQLRPGEVTQERLRSLLENNRNNRLTDAERVELNEYMQLEHFIRRMKIRAREKLSNRSSKET